MLYNILCTIKDNITGYQNVCCREPVHKKILKKILFIIPESQYEFYNFTFIYPGKKSNKITLMIEKF